MLPRVLARTPGATVTEGAIVPPSDGRLLEVGPDPDDHPGHVVQRQTSPHSGPADSTR